jgi:hypothetical protein
MQAPLTGEKNKKNQEKSANQNNQKNQGYNIENKTIRNASKKPTTF